MLVSVITPCLNSEKTIRDTIESVLCQSYKNIEYIIVDGGSTDGTLGIIREYVLPFRGRLRYVSESDGGIYNAMNKGIRMSHGRLIGIINSDDFYEPDAVGKAVRSMSGSECQVIYGYCNILGKHGEVRYVNMNTHHNIFQYPFQHPACFITRKTYCKYGMYNERYRVAADCDLLYRLYRNHVEFIQVREILADYRAGGYSDRTEHETELALAKLLNGGIHFRQFIGVVISRYLWRTAV